MSKKREIGGSSIAIAIVVLALFMLKVSNNNQSSDIQIHMRDLAIQTEFKETQRVESLKKDMKEEYDYLIENDLVFEKFSEEHKELNPILAEKFGEIARPEFPLPVRTVVSAELHGSVMDKYRKGEISFDEIYENLENNTKAMYVEYFMFVDEEEPMNYVTEYIDVDIFDRLFKVIPVQDKTKIAVTLRTFPNSAKNKVESVIEAHLFNRDEMLRELYELNVDFTYQTNDYGGLKRDWVNEITKYLYEKYGEEFVVYDGFYQMFYTDADKNGLNNSKVICSPIAKPEIKFLASRTSPNDKYLSIVTQREISLLIENIIAKHGLERTMVQFTAPTGLIHSAGAVDARHEQKYDTTSIHNPIDLIDKYEGDFDINLIYLKPPKEEIDFEGLKSVIEGVSSMLPEKSNEEKHYLIYMSVYEIPEEVRDILTVSFKKDVYTENIYREAYALAEIMEKSEVNRANTLGFELLDIYGERLGYGYTGNGSVVESWTTEKFLEMTTWKED